ncbi:hypothetical protein [Myxococcus qinghaiensis]|uniref:hypothetical protein n=1 Tax=Myxococcus qinghaiensis TaxID=2906758 RepID=UPI0020A7E20C|nr:hypothetical protein [Myxococcus qinghaiensis]MCP3161364.1 hypothetical protein [Myxococcus qinghaiensis]
MAKKADSSIENRVYLFESLASSYVAAASEALGSKDSAERERARRVLAELAFVSCVVADTEDLTPEQVRERVLSAPPADAAPGKRGSRRKRDK